jgi:hypothetical protein
MSNRPLLCSWRSRLRISVRGLMVLVLITGGGLGWVIHRGLIRGR